MVAVKPSAAGRHSSSAQLSRNVSGGASHVTYSLPKQRHRQRVACQSPLSPRRCSGNGNVLLRAVLPAARELLPGKSGGGALVDP